MRPRTLWLVGTLLLSPALGTLSAWDFEGHRLVNELALGSLPPEFPAFVRTPEAGERIGFLAGEPDRWRNTAEMVLQHTNALDHYFDVEYLPLHGLDPRRVSPFRFRFAAEFAAARTARPEALGPIDEGKNRDATGEWPGFLPWAITENYAKLQSGFSALREYEAAGLTREAEEVRRNIVYIMGVMGHYVGDAAQPLHTTRHHHGWVGPNPEGFTEARTIHGWIDGGFIAQAGLAAAEVQRQARRPRLLEVGAGADGRPRIFDAVMAYVLAQHEQLVPLYQLEKEGGFNPAFGRGDRGREFIAGRFAAAAEMLSSLWLTAWQTAPVDTYLRNQLAERSRTAPPPGN